MVLFFVLRLHHLCIKNFPHGKAPLEQINKRVFSTPSITIP